MAGATSNVSLWDEADAYALFPEDIEPGKTIADYYPATPDEDWEDAGPWRLIGLLNGDAGFEDNRSRDDNSHPAWGYGTIIKSFKNPEYEAKLTALEDNPVTARLKSNNDTETDVVASTHTPCYLGFETRDRRGKKRRRATRSLCDVTYDGGTQNDSDLDEAEFTASVYPDDLKRVYWKQDESTLNPVPPQPVVAVFTIDNEVTAYTVSVTTSGAAQTTASVSTKTATALRSALEALANVGAGNVTVTGSSGGPLTATFDADLGVTVVTADGTGGTVTVS